MLNSQALVQQIELSCKTDPPDVMALIANFDQVQALIAASTVALLQIKEETAAKL